jgi:hypothetical protein
MKKITALAKEQVLAYPTVKFTAGKVLQLKRKRGFLLLTLKENIYCKKVANYNRRFDKMLPISGFAES